MQHSTINNAPPTWAKNKNLKEKAPPHKQRQDAIKVMERINNPARNASTCIQHMFPKQTLALLEMLLLSFNVPPIQAKNKQSEVRVPPITHAKKNGRERQHVLACPATHQQRQIDYKPSHQAYMLQALRHRCTALFSLSTTSRHRGPRLNIKKTTQSRYQ